MKHWIAILFFALSFGVHLNALARNGIPEVSEAPHSQCLEDVALVGASHTNGHFDEEARRTRARQGYVRTLLDNIGHGEFAEMSNEELTELYRTGQFQAREVQQRVALSFAAMIVKNMADVGISTTDPFYSEYFWVLIPRDFKGLITTRF